ncbi:MAG: adenylate/guanylate cyclase domain-containing protein [Acidimicrobiia bacterium]
MTFLFTDLESSTRLWEEHPEAMRTALARHDEILRDAVDGHGGHVVKTTGDGLHAAFATAHDAIRAAIEAQRDLSDTDWGPIGNLGVRMGVHTGEAELRDDDYYGTAVNRAARVSAAAHGGQILVSHATEELVRDGLGSDVTLLDHGEHRLRDLARPERLYQLGAPGLRDEFPPIRSLDAYPGTSPRSSRRSSAATASSPRSRRPSTRATSSR